MREAGRYEMILHRASAKVQNFPVSLLGKQEVMQHLQMITFDKLGQRFQLVDYTLVHHKICIIHFEKTVVDNTNCHFLPRLHARLPAAMRELGLKNSFLRESSEFIVDIKSQSHNLSIDRMKLLLVMQPQGFGTFNGHQNKNLLNLSREPPK